MAGLCLAGLGGSKAINSILFPCFSFSPSQQGTWSLLGTNYWPSVGPKLPGLLRRQHLEEKSCLLRNEKKERRRGLLLLYESKIWVEISSHPICPSFPLPIFSQLLPIPTHSDLPQLPGVIGLSVEPPDGVPTHILDSSRD